MSRSARSRTTARLGLTLLLATAGLLVAAATAGAAYLKIDGIKGESSSAGHEGWIEIESFNFAIEPGSGGDTASRGEAATLRDLVVTKDYDMASPKLFLAGARGDIFREAVLEVCRPSRDTEASQETCFMTVRFNDVQVSHMLTGGQWDSTPSDSVALRYTGLEWTHVDPSGKLTSVAIAPNS